MAEKEIQKDTKNKTRSRELSGVVVSDKMDGGVVVAVTRYVKSPKYKKFIKRVKRYKANDPENTHTEGDKVRIKECRPISKGKHFRVVN